MKDMRPVYFVLVLVVVLFAFRESETRLPEKLRWIADLDKQLFSFAQDRVTYSMLNYAVMLASIVGIGFVGLRSPQKINDQASRSQNAPMANVKHQNREVEDDTEEKTEPSNPFLKAVPEWKLKEENDGEKD